MPTLNIRRVINWPINEQNNIEINANYEVPEDLSEEENNENIDVVNNSFIEEDGEDQKIANKYHITEKSQQMLLFRFCYFCGEMVDENTIRTVIFKF